MQYNTIQYNTIQYNTILDLVDTMVQKQKDNIICNNGEKINKLAVHARDIHTILEPGYSRGSNYRDNNWLNDEVINFYVWLILKRHRSELERLESLSAGAEENYPKVHMFNTFFFKYLCKNYTKVRRWTKKTDIFGMDFVIVPIHVNGNHWCLGLINFVHKKVQYYDSLRGSNQPALDLLLEYVQLEYKDKKKGDLNMDEWVKENRQDIPRQQNGFDCGVFMCMFAEYISRGTLHMDFSQDNILFFRKRMVYEIATKKLMN